MLSNIVYAQLIKPLCARIVERLKYLKVGLETNCQLKILTYALMYTTPPSLSTACMNLLQLVF